MLSQQVAELRVQIDNIFARRENFTNHVREGFDVDGRIGAERISGYLEALRDEQVVAEDWLEELERELEDLKRDCENDQVSVIDCNYIVCMFRGGVSLEVYEEVVSTLIGQKELLEIELAIIRSEWDAFYREIQDYYTSVEAIEKFADLNVRQANVLDEIKR